MDITRSTRRIVTGHDADGKAIAAFDGPVASRQRSPGGNAVTMLWVTAESPADVAGRADRAETKVGVPPPPAGSIFRIVDFAPAAGAPPVDHHAMLIGMGIDPATQGYMRHPHTHRTRSVDYAIVLEGEIDMLMDDTEVHVQAGDVLVQQGTNHAWVNNGTRPCRIAFVLIDAKEPPAWSQGWTA
jgi:mannose-6-phosphate isomerase-like protein (cupin superfamily)